MTDPEVVSPPKTYLYVDETGSLDGAFFMVVVLAIPAHQRETLEHLVAQLEMTSGRGNHKWTRTAVKYKMAWLALLEPVLAQLAPVYWREYRHGKDFVVWTAETVTDVAAGFDPGTLFYAKLDGYNQAELEVVRKMMRGKGLSWKKLVGGRDQADPMLRMADALAGLLREVKEQDTRILAAFEKLQSYFTKV